MTHAKDKAHWIESWKTEIHYLWRMYQGFADPELYEELRTKIKELKSLAEKIGNKLEEEGTWDKRK